MMEQKEFGANLFDNSLKCALRSKFLLYLPEIMHSKAFMNPFEMKQVKDDNLRWLGPALNLFGPLDILNGHSVIEFFDNEYALNKALDRTLELEPLSIE